MRVCIICVCHNTHKEFYDYYSSIRGADANEMADVVLLDNSDQISESQVKSYKEMSAADKKFTYARVKNIGYIGSAQYFLQTSQIDISNYDFLCISNVDLLLKEDFFSTLEGVFSGICDDVGMLAPKIITADNINKNPKVVVRPTLKNLLIRKLLFSSAATHLLLEKMHLLRKRLARHNEREKKLAKLESIYAAHGSFFLFARPAIEAVVNNTYPVFLFGEELFFAELMKKYQLSTYYVEELVIYDSEHASTGAMKSASYRQHNRIALQYILETFYR